ncbi:MAG: diaminopimelate epimerase [Chloroflexi bacterium]|nr:diaminopimelate epimerase [Chloroflexota bacterium]
MRFTKMQAVGNDFVVVQAIQEQDWASLARAVCHRHFGVGADGLLVVSPVTDADVAMRVFNPDGSEAEACGNGLRCVARYAVERGLVTPRNGELLIATQAGLRRAKLFTEKGQVAVRVSLGAPQFAPRDIPMAVDVPEAGPVLDYPLMAGGMGLKVACLSMGNPHAVAFPESPVADFPLAQVGPAVERHPAFPNRVNFEVVNIVDQGRAMMRVWERGAGETLGCGSGACAVAVAARLKGLVGNEVQIALPGGVVMVAWDGREEVFLTGPAETVFEGEWIG